MSSHARSLLGVATVLVVVAGLVALGSQWASDAPDGFTKVAREHGLEGTERPHPLVEGPVADYRAEGVDNRIVASGIAVLAGVLLTFVILVGALRVARRRRGPS